MGRINVLDSITANAIKAGEVIERPVSVVKELIDNSVDAGATSIKIEFENGGIGLIRVSDNGIGMDDEDSKKAFLIHATSKITSVEDIYDLSTQGFRGEALASVAACSEVRLITRQADAESGILVHYKDGVLVENRECPADIGTVVEVSSLFANIPARYKFLKKDSTEGMYICTLVEKLAIVNPHIAFKLIKDGKQLLSTPGTGDMKDVIYSIYGKQIANNLIEVDYDFEGYKLRGYTGKTDLVRGNRGMQYIYVNDRSIRNQTITAAIDEAYRNAIMKNKYAICFLCIYSVPGMVDVNVHPQKSEVRFTNESDVFKLVYHGVKNAIFSGNDAGHKFGGIIDNVDVPEIIKDASNNSSEELGDSKQLKFSVTNKPISTPTKQENEATAQMLRILAEFKPDFNEITGDNTTSDSSETVAADVPEFIETKTENPTPIEDNISISNNNIEIVASDDEYTSDIDELNKSKFVGFLFDTYIIMQSTSSVFFVDQHAAHERVLYERVMNRKLNATINNDRQELLVPQIVDLSSSDYSFIEDNLSRFNDTGFDLEMLDSRQVAIRAVPVTARTAKPSEMLTQILLDLKKETDEKSSVWYSLIQTTACKAAIKAHDKITKEEALNLVDQMLLLDDPYHCAHGRPTFIKVTMTEFEKNFKRIV